MLTISNWWGMFFSFGIPVILLIIGAYYSGIERGKELRRRRK